MLRKHIGPLRSLDYTGFVHCSLTWCCESRKALFLQKESVDLVQLQFLRAATENEIAIIAYCFMPDHVHQLVTGTSLTADVRQYMRKAKQYSGYYYSQAFGERLWQRYGHDHRLRQIDDPHAVARYILANPVVDGLVNRIEEYAHTGSTIYSVDELVKWAYGVDASSLSG
jgi:putative transposase